MKTTEQLLDWPLIQDQLIRYCLTPYGQNLWQRSPFIKAPNQLSPHMLQVDALLQWLVHFGLPILPTRSTQAVSHEDVTPILRFIEKGGVVDAYRLAQCLVSLQDALAIMDWLHRAAQQKPHSAILSLPEMEDPTEAPSTEGFSLNLFAENEREWLRSATQRLQQHVNPEGQILESATPTLYGLFQRKRQQAVSIEQQFQKYMNDTTVATALQDKLVMQREGRFVLPVKVEQKSVIGGVIRGTSGSGSTVYMEPHWAVTENNRQAENDADIQQEIQRILAEDSAWLREHCAIVSAILHRLGEWDRRLAGAQLSKALDATIVEIVREGDTGFCLNQLRHPVLVLQRRQQGTLATEPVIPNTIYLGKQDSPKISSLRTSEKEDSRVMVITGSNTGGKTVLLKAVGLCALMLNAGLPLPVAEGSTMSVFQPILVDMGDEQNLTQNLSTFSASIQRLSSFFHPNIPLKRSLILIDEIASGTDPVEGAALAGAILESLYHGGALVMATTHLGALKTEAAELPGIINASVVFDSEKLQPTYQLLMGVPGTSHALSIAQQHGIPKAVLQKAHDRMEHTRHRNVDQLAAELTDKQQELTRQINTVERERAMVEATRKALESEYSTLREQKKQIVYQYRSSLRNRLSEVDHRLKHLKSTLKKARVPDRSNLQQLRQDWRLANDSTADILLGAEHQLKEDEYAQSGTMRPEDKIKALKIGERVFYEPSSLWGEVVQLSPETLEVTLQAGIMKLRVPVSELKIDPAAHMRHYKPKFGGKQAGKASAKPGKVRKPRGTQGAGTPGAETEMGTGRGAALVHRECDLRGERVEAALERLEIFLSDAMHQGEDAVGVIHGHGTGALKKAVRDLLRSLSYVKTSYAAEANDGGDGKTIVEFR